VDAGTYKATLFSGISPGQRAGISLLKILFLFYSVDIWHRKKHIFNFLPVLNIGSYPQ
jgi:hypothetical protein